MLAEKFPVEFYHFVEGREGVIGGAFPIRTNAN